MRWGQRHGFPNNDPAAGLNMEGSGGDGRLWSDAAIAAAVTFFDGEGRHSLGTAIALNAWLGQRENDLLGLRRSQYRNGTIALTPSKTRRSTGKRVWLPVGTVPHLSARLEAELARLDARDGNGQVNRIDGLLIVDEQTGQPYTGNNFRNHLAHMRRTVGAPALAAWRTAKGLTGAEAARELAGNTGADWSAWDWKGWEATHKTVDWPSDQPFTMMPAIALDRLFELDERAAADPRLELLALQFMHLRHTAVTRMSEGGATPQQVSAVTGHSVRWIQQILEIYGIRTRKLAEQAFTLRLQAEGE